MSAYYFHDGRNEVGPFTIDLLKKQKITRNTPVRLEGADNWSPAEKIGGLKDLVAPKKIRRPKDILPVVIEQVTDFRQRRPKTLYGVLFGIAFLGGLSIYSSGKGTNKELPKSVTQNTAGIPGGEPVVAAGVSPKVQTAAAPEIKADAAKAARLKWGKLISATNSNYGIGFLGGIKDLKVIVSNRSDYPVDQAVAKVTYIKANGEVWKTKLITVQGVPSHDSKEQSVPDVGRGKKVTVSLQKVVSKRMKFSYTAGQKITNSEDPYFKG